MRKGSITCREPLGLEPFGSEFLDTARNPEFIEGLKAEGLTVETSTI
jgi:hypothetical protein